MRGFWRDREPSWRHLGMDDPVMVLDVGRGEFPVPDGPSYTIQPGDPPEALANFLTSLAWPPQQVLKPNRAQRRRVRKYA